MQAFIGQVPPVIVKKGMALLSLSKDAQRGACPRSRTADVVQTAQTMLAFAAKLNHIEAGNQRASQW